MSDCSPIGLRIAALFVVAAVFVGAGCVGGLAFAATADESAKELPDSKSPAADLEASTSASDDATRVPVEVARDRAKLMQEIYETTLHVMHDRYFHADRSIVPARAMEDVFSDLERRNGSKANWISVNLRAMSINHEPKTDFEKRAAREIAAGHSEVEAVEDGYYRQATAISMTGGCLSCHAGLFNQASKSNKYSGLVISIPVVMEPDEK